MDGNTTKTNHESLHLDTYGITTSECLLCTKNETLYVIELNNNKGFIILHESHINKK